ncbi:ribonuclease E/G, partial [Neisseria meningitidis]|uniref:ribonuclease E/G n=1 Tax=Neisseria meningitidis TaxID=487 RepID=UPI001F0C0C38
GVPRRIEGEERQELKAAMAELDIPNGMSIIARTAGIGRSAEELEWDLNYLKQLWQAIEEAGKAHHDPYLLFMESSLLIRAIRDYFRPDIGEILVDNQEVYDQVAEFMSYVMPGNIGRLKLYEDHTPLFSRFQIEHQIESAFSRSVSLPSGGAIVIDHTEALVSIDVNSARATRGADIEDTAFKTNMEAAEEVARQMRLRDLGGLVVIDFIDMENPKHQRDVENVLRDALKKDRARVQMGKLSRFGLLELSRQRLKPALGESSHVACPRCAGTGVIRGIESTALHVLRIIQEEAMKDNTGEVRAQVPVDVATFLLNEKRAELFAMEERLDVNVVLIPNIHLENPHYEINRIRTDDVEEDGEPSYKRVAEPEEDESAKPFGGEKAKAARPEPAVKGVRHTSPAPTAAPEKKTSWWDSFKAWLKRIFGGSETQAAPAAETSEKRSTANRSGSRANNRRQNPRRSKREGSKVEVREVAGKTAGQEARADKAETRNNGNRRRNERGDRAAERANEAEIQSRNVQPAATVADAAPSETEMQTGKRRRNGSRSERSQTAPETAAVAETAVQTAENTPSEPHTAEDKGSKPKSERNRRERDSRDAKERRERNNQRDRRQNGKKRNIPSAAKIEQYLNIHDTADKVRSAAAHVFGETDANAPITVSIADPVAERDLPTASPAVSNGDAPVYDAAEKIRRATAAILPEGATPKAEAQEMPSETATFTAAAEQARETAQTGGLVLIETDPAALKAWAAQPEVQTGRGLRRSEQPKPSEVATVPAEEMIQVETRQG